MLDFLTVEQKRFLVDNRGILSNLFVASVVGATATLVGSACKIVFNLHDYEEKRVVRNNPNEDFVVFENISWDADIRDSIRPNFHKEEKEALNEYYGTDEDGKKIKKKSKKKKKEGGLFK